MLAPLTWQYFAETLNLKEEKGSQDKYADIHLHNLQLANTSFQTVRFEEKDVLEHLHTYVVDSLSCHINPGLRR